VTEPDDVGAQARIRAARASAAWSGGLLVLLYALTAAPEVTWWDAGEFIAAAHTLGIPHPPGTPLYIMIAHVWADAFAWLGTAQSVNLLSGVCTAAAGALMASTITRATGSVIAGVGAALCAGSMSTVWLSATEAEVYAPSLLLGMLMLRSADRAGESGESRYVVLTAYLFALAAPLHLTALVAAPAAIVLAMTRSTAARDANAFKDLSPRGIVAIGARWRWLNGLVLALALIAAGGVGTGRWWLGLAALGGLFVLPAVMRRRPHPPGDATADAGINLPSRTWLVPVAVCIALSAFAFLIVRAAHDPAINQGNPATFDAMLTVIAREQYSVAGLLPRQAPFWLQVVNFLEYADWQVALGFGSTVMPTVPRLLATIAFIVLGAMGSHAHRRLDPRSWRGLAVLGACGSLGVIVYLNLKAGPSIGYGILPDDAPHEPRERDYFFALAFWTWGVWAGLGAVSFARRWLTHRPQLASAVGVAVAALPLLLNFAAMNRRTEPDASMPLQVASELLAASPLQAVLLVAGDNDTYPLWYAQHVLGIRPDVVVITLPLLGARWYREELGRRWSIGETPVAAWRGLRTELASVARTARGHGRPVAVAATVERPVREYLGRSWRLTGVVYVEDDAPASGGSLPSPGEPAIDTAAVQEAADRLDPVLARSLREAIDPTARLMREVLECPSLARRAAADTVAARLLDSTCNYR
jgi:uncharacterized membrane protein